MKQHAAIVIAALMITSMAFAISTTTTSVSAGSATLEPTRAWRDTKVKFTVTVTNDTADNIDNIRIFVSGDPTPAFNQAIGGAETAENLKLAADNLENVVAPLKRAGENLKLAAENKEAAGSDLVTAGESFMSLNAAAWEANAGAGHIGAADNVFALVYNAGDNLKKAGQEMEEASENFTYIAEYLSDVATKLDWAAGDPVSATEENMDNWDSTAASYLDNAADNLRAAADNLLGGSLNLAGSYLENAGDNLEHTGTELGGTVGDALQDAGQALKDAGLQLQAAAQYNSNAGTNLVDAAAHLQSAGSYIGLADLTAAGDNLENAAANASGSIDSAGDNLTAATDNVLAAGAALSSAATYLSAAATELGADLGGDELEDAMEHENAAAENLKVGDVDLGTAGDQLIAAADDISASATKLLATADALAPATWTMDDGANYVQFDAIGDNVITPGGSETFVFLWTTPNCSPVENVYTIRVASSAEGATSWRLELETELTVDGKPPSLTIVVTQTGVAVNNLVGNVYQDGKATITITADEELQSIGTVYVENAGQPENFLPPITLTTTDDITFTGTFTVGAWDDNTCQVSVTSAKDLIGNENDAIDNRSFTVDTRVPIFIDNGLTGIITAVATDVTQAGTGTVFAYVDNDPAKSFIIIVEDNIANVDNDLWVTSVAIEWDTNVVSAGRDAVVDNRWTKTITLTEGLSPLLKVTATDRTGNTVSDNIENIMIDVQAPTIEFNTIAGKTWTDGIPINNNMPEIKITVRDPGYPDTGLGVADENLTVYLDNDDNFLNGSGYSMVLDNKDPWDFGLAGVFENVIDNAGSGLLEGTYWITVAASDNIAHDGEENQYGARSFIVDTTAPLAPSVGDAYKIVSTMDSPVVVKDASRTIAGTAEAGADITVYGTVDTTEKVLGTATAGSDNKWTVTFTLTAGSNTKIEVSATDEAGNEGDRELYGWMLADASAPSVTLAEVPDTTDKTSITISGTVSKDAWEDWSEITLTVQVGVGKVTVPCVGGSYEYSVALSEGPNTIVVQATDDIGNTSVAEHAVVERVVTPWATYAIILVIIALVLAAIAIFRKR